MPFLKIDKAGGVLRTRTRPTLCSHEPSRRGVDGKRTRRPNLNRRNEYSYARLCEHCFHPEGDSCSHFESSACSQGSSCQGLQPEAQGVQLMKDIPGGELPLETRVGSAWFQRSKRENV